MSAVLSTQGDAMVTPMSGTRLCRKSTKACQGALGRPAQATRNPLGTTMIRLENDGGWAIAPPRQLFGILRNHASSRTHVHLPITHLHQPTPQEDYWHAILPARSSARHLLPTTQRMSTSYMPRVHRGLRRRRQLRCTRCARWRQTSSEQHGERLDASTTSLRYKW